MIPLLRDRRAIDQTVANLLVLLVSLAAIATALAIVIPLVDQYASRNKIREAESLMVSLKNEILKVQEEPFGSRRTIELDVQTGGIEILNDPERLICYVRVSKAVPVDVQGLDFSHTARGAMLRANLSVTFQEKKFIGPGSNLVYITKMQDGKINVTSEVYA